MPQPCPVPVEQQPINEYQDVKESWFYGWGSRDMVGYLKPVIILWSVGWVVAGPMAAASPRIAGLENKVAAAGVVVAAAAVTSWSCPTSFLCCGSSVISTLQTSEA